MNGITMMTDLFVVAKEYLDDKTNRKRKRIIQSADRKVHYAGKTVLDGNSAQTAIRELIASGKPCCIARLGATELFCMGTFEFGIAGKQGKSINQLHEWSGFFPNDVAYGNRFNQCMKDACAQMDFLGIWAPKFEEYFIRKYVPKSVQLTHLFDLEPWKHPENPWSDILEGKKVLVIHPFTETIQGQYTKRGRLFDNTNILPPFELKTLKAVQTVAGEKDKRFADWFDALEWMYQEALKIDFDIAIIGCGAYGFPLAAKLKQAGKQAFHLGGATQLLFGIKGRRWVENDDFAYIQAFFNDAWEYPSEKDKPKNAQKVEGACYW